MAGVETLRSEYHRQSPNSSARKGGHMSASLRTLGAAGIMWYMASMAMASPTIDTSLANYPEWNEKSTLPSAAASVPFMKDSAVELASDDEPATAESKNDSNCSSCQECNSCGGCEIN